MSTALHDYRCPRCGHVARDQAVEISVGATAGAPECPNCLDLHNVVRMEWIPKIGRMDAANGPGFVAFDTYNGRNEKVTVTSLAQLRQIERQSEIDHRNGEGQPLVFRAFSNDPSNKDKSALHKDWHGGEQPTAEGKHKFGSTLQKSLEEPAGEFGPGVTDANTSALGGLD